MSNPLRGTLYIKYDDFRAFERYRRYPLTGDGNI